MDKSPHFALPQDDETPTFYAQTERFYYRAAYSRSTDSYNNNELGQDYLTFATNGKRFAFALCDGVSQSFYGDLAARILGEKLLMSAWLLNIQQTNDQIQENLLDELNRLTKDGSQIVRDHPIPVQISPMVRRVLDKKRILGSESTFIAGLIDASSNIAKFVWMGDSRLRLWRGDTELLAQFKDSFKTSERWSTVKGPVGDLHLVSIPLSDFDHLIVYSDGFSYLDAAYQTAKIKYPFSNHAIDAFIADAALHPSSDDISFLEVWTSPNSPQFPKDGENLVVSNPKYQQYGKTHFLSWSPVAGATEYEIRLSSENTTTLSKVKIDVEEWQHDGDLDANTHFISVRAWRNSEPGDWSDFLPLRTTIHFASSGLINDSPTLGPETSPLTSLAPTHRQTIHAETSPSLDIDPITLPSQSSEAIAHEFKPASSAIQSPKKLLQTDLYSDTPTHLVKPKSPKFCKKPALFWRWGLMILLLCFGLMLVGIKSGISKRMASALGFSLNEIPTATLKKTPYESTTLAITPSSTPTLTNTPTPSAIDAAQITFTNTPSSNTQIWAQIQRTPYVQFNPYPNLAYSPAPSAINHQPGEKVALLKKYTASGVDWYFVRTFDNDDGWLPGVWLDLNNVDTQMILVEENVIFPELTQEKKP